VAKKKNPIVTTSPLAGEVEREFTTGLWSGQTQYKCNDCLYDTFNKKQMLTHLVEQHGSMAALEELFPSGSKSQTVLLQEPERPTSQEFPGEVYEIEFEEVEDATNNSG
jgi:hypothetical protein